MRKTIGIIVALCAIVTFSVFIVLINIKLNFSPTQLKAYFNKTNAYNIGMSYVKESLAKDDLLDLNNGKNLEALDTIINLDSTKIFIDDTIDRLFQAIKNPVENNMVFTIHYTNYDDTGFATGVIFSKTVNLHNNIPFLVLSHLNLLLICFGVISLLLLTLAVYTFSESASEKMALLGWFLALEMVILIATFALARFIAPNYMETLTAELKFVAETKLLNGGQKILSQIAIDQSNYYIVETVGLFFLSATALFFARLFKREKIRDLDDRF